MYLTTLKLKVSAGIDAANSGIGNTPDVLQ